MLNTCVGCATGSETTSLTPPSSTQANTPTVGKTASPSSRWPYSARNGRRHRHRSAKPQVMPTPRPQRRRHCVQPCFTQSVVPPMRCDNRLGPPVTAAPSDAHAHADERAGVRMYVVQVDLVSRAITTATSLAGALGLKVNDAIVIQNSNTLSLRLLPCDVFARTALLGQEVAAFEVRLARGLAAATGPVVSLDPRVEPRVYEVDGFAITFWTYYEARLEPAEPAEYAVALQRLHAAMRNIQIEAPHFMERVAAAERVVTNRSESPALDDRDRDLLLSTLHSAGEAIQRRAATDQLLHGEPHPGNLLSTPGGIVFVDFETCCVGPIEFDVAHAPVEVGTHYPGLDRVRLEECRGLILALVAAWRWDLHDQFPDGLRHGRDLLGLLRAGPPWPALGTLSIG